MRLRRKARGRTLGRHGMQQTSRGWPANPVAAKTLEQLPRDATKRDTTSEQFQPGGGLSWQAPREHDLAGVHMSGLPYPKNEQI